MKHYNFDPDYAPEQGDKSDVFSKMVHDLDGFNLRVDVKTLRTHMDRAVTYARGKNFIHKKISGKPVAR